MDARGLDFSLRQPASAASSRSISALAPIGFGRKSVAPAFIAATAVVSDPDTLVAISGYSPPAKSVRRAAPPIVSRSAIMMAPHSRHATAAQRLGLAGTGVGLKRPSERSAIMPAKRSALARIGVDDEHVDRLWAAAESHYRATPPLRFAKAFPVFVARLG